MLECFQGLDCHTAYFSVFNDLYIDCTLASLYYNENKGRKKAEIMKGTRTFSIHTSEKKEGLLLGKNEGIALLLRLLLLL